MKAEIKGGLIGAGIFLLLAIIWWLYVSSVHNCLLDPIQSVNVGGIDCSFHVSIYSLISSTGYFIFPTVIGFFIGALIGSIIGLIISKIRGNEK